MLVGKYAKGIRNLELAPGADPPDHLQRHEEMVRRQVTYQYSRYG